MHVLNEIARNVMHVTRPPLNEIHKKKRIAWGEKCTKADFRHGFHG